MNSTSTRIQLIQCQIEIAKAMLLCGELVEYDAKWLKNAKTVVRDKSGKFASKAASIKEDAEAIAKSSGDILNISADAIGQMVKDPGFRKRAGLEASAMIGKSIGNLVAQAKIFPGLEKQVDKLIAEQEKKLADIYGKDNNALAQSFRKTKLPQPKKDASFKEKLEFQAARYKAYEDTLKNPQHRTNLDDVAAIGKAAVPVAAGLGLNLAIDLAVPLLLGNPLSLGALAAASVASYAASEAASFGTKKLLDKTELTDNQKMVADIAVRILAGAAVSGAASKVAGSIAEKKAAEVAAKKAAEEAELAKKAAEEADSAIKQAIKKKIPKFPDGVTETIIESTDNHTMVSYSFDVDGVRTDLFVNHVDKDNFTTFSFDVAGDMDMKTSLSKKTKKMIALKLRRTFDYLVHHLDDDSTLGCTPYAGDGFKEYRQSVYESMGFSEIQGQYDVQLAQIKNGKVEPFRPPDIEAWLSSLSPD
jgi:hypothetical protein